MDGVDTYALLAAHIAAPVEDAVALLLPFLSPGVVAPTAAQQLTEVQCSPLHSADNAAGNLGME